MKNITLILIYIWAILIENAIGMPSLFKAGGFDVKVSFLFKILIFILIIRQTIFLRRKNRLHKSVYLFSIIILLSSLSVISYAPQLLIKTLSVNFHIQVVLFFISFISNSKLDEAQLIKVIKHINFFAIFNSVLLYVSYFFPNASSAFESNEALNGEARRAFGIMGDQLPYLLTFFCYQALVNNKIYLYFFFSIAILMTASLNASGILLVITLYYYIFQKRITKVFILRATLTLAILTSAFVVKPDLFMQLGPVKRIMGGAVEDEEGSTGALRLLSFTTAFEMIQNKPILGYGYGAYFFVIQEKFSAIYQGTNEDYKLNSALSILGSAYNQFIQMLCESGIIGLFIFIYLIRGFLKTTKSVNQNLNPIINSFVKASYGWILIFTLTSLTATWLLPISFLWIFMSVFVGIAYRAQFLSANKLTLVNNEYYSISV